MTSIADLIRIVFHYVTNPFLLSGLLLGMTLFRELRPRWSFSLLRLTFDVVSFAAGLLFLFLIITRATSAALP